MRNANVLPCRGRGHTSTRGPNDHPEPYEERLGHCLDRLWFLTHRDRKSGEPDRAPTEPANEHVKDGPVDAIHAKGVDLIELESSGRRWFIHDAIAVYLCPVTDSPQQAVRDTGSTAAPTCDLDRTRLPKVDPQKLRRSLENDLEVRWVIEIQMRSESEAVP